MFILAIDVKHRITNHCKD